MANFSSLIAEIQQYIKSNLAQAITGPVLQQVLLDMVGAINQLKQDTLEGYSFYGQPLAPGGSVSVTQNTFFLVGPGTYTINGTAYVVSGAGVSVLVYDCVEDEVSTAALFPYDAAPTEGSANGVTSGGVKTALDGVAAEAAAAIEHAKGAAGLAEALLDTDSEGAEQEFSLRKSGGDGGAYFRRLLGNTKAFNQLIRGFASWTAQNGTIAQADGVLTYTVTNATGLTTQYAGDMANINPIAGHKYFMTIGVKLAHTGRVYLGGAGWGSGVTWGLQNYTTANVWQFYSRIVDAVSTATGANAYCSLYEYTDGASIAVNDTMQITAPMLIDLTLMFGAGNEPASVAEFREKYPLLYYAYGRKLIHNKVAKVITKGANQWDEVWELGRINPTTGADVLDSTTIRSKNYIPCFPSTQYYVKNPANIIIVTYDSNKNANGWIVYGAGNGTFTTPSNAAFMRFSLYTGAGTTYANDICISLSDAEINGQYFPYWERELALDITNQEDTDGNKPFAEGMMGAGSAADYANEVGGAKVMAKVKFSDLSWTYDSTSEYFSAIILDMLAPSTSEGRLDGIVCSAYPVDTITGISLSGTDKTCKRYNSRIYVKDTAYTDAITFKAAMGDAELVYEKAAPVPFTWKEPLNTGIKVSKYGTEEITPAQTENIDTAPFRAVTTYSISVANLIAALSALGNRGGAKGLLGSGNQEENPENEELTPEEESPKEEQPKEEETPVVEPIPEVQSKR